MKTFSLETIPKFLKGTSVALGVFDGLHRAHRMIIDNLKNDAAKRGCHAMVITFDPHPRQVIKDERKPIGVLTTLNEKVSLLENWGIEYLLVLPSTRQFLQQSPVTFVRDILVEKLQVCAVFIGYDYRFGYQRQGDATRLRQLGEELGFKVEVFPEFTYEGELIKSSTIRQYLLAGNVQAANRLLGRPYSFVGMVVPGSGRGRQLGFPTANLKVLAEEKLIPGQGVYLAQVGQYFGMLNIGVRKTFGENQLTIEIHLIDFPNKELYGELLTVSVLERLRDEIRFPSVEGLVQQLQIDRQLCQQKMLKNKREMEVMSK